MVDAADADGAAAAFDVATVVVAALDGVVLGVDSLDSAVAELFEPGAPTIVRADLSATAAMPGLDSARFTGVGTAAEGGSTVLD